uniref:C3H1-type domain-containing protein n=1 Tax=Trichuris muris TaxID=70415 RepID=A0A5S6QVP2_TRIMR
MEDGELPEEGEISDDDLFFVQNSSGAGKADAAPDDNLLSVFQQSSDVSLSTGEGKPGGIEEVLKKKRQELAEKVKSELRVATGGQETPGEWFTTDDDSPVVGGPVSLKANAASRPKRASRDRASPVAAKKAFKGVTSANKFYHDLDRTEDATELMLSNWVMGAKKADRRQKEAPALGGGSPGNDSSLLSDGYEEYYGRASLPSPGSDRQNSEATFPGVTELQDSAARLGDKTVDSEQSRRGASARGRYLAKTTAGGKNDSGESEELTGSRKRRRSRRSARGGRRKRSRSESSQSQRSRSDERAKNVRSSTATARSRRRRSRSSRRDRGRGERRERPLCKFFKEGYCREGDKCLFVHTPAAAKPASGRRKELCKYFAVGYCRNNQRCQFVHEYQASKFFPDDRSARYSHEMTKDTSGRASSVDKEAEEVSKPSLEAPRRKVLLGLPPKQMMMPPSHSSSSGLLPAPSTESIADYEGNLHRAENQPCGYLAGDSIGLLHRGGSVSTEEVPNSDNAPKGGQEAPEGAKGGDQPVATFDIAAMLRQIKAQVKGVEVQDSPASPDPCDDLSENFFVVKPPVVRPPYRWISLDLAPLEKISEATLAAYLQDEKLRADPRLKKYFKNQFDLVSNKITSHQVPIKDLREEKQTSLSLAFHKEMDVSRQVPSEVDTTFKDPRLARVQQQLAAEVARQSASESSSSVYSSAQHSPQSTVGNSLHGTQVRLKDSRPFDYETYGSPAVSDGDVYPPDDGGSLYGANAGAGARMRAPLIANPHVYSNYSHNGYYPPSSSSGWIPGGGSYSRYKPSSSGYVPQASLRSQAPNADPRTRRQPLQTKPRGQSEATLEDTTAQTDSQNIGDVASDGASESKISVSPVTENGKQENEVKVGSTVTLPSLRERRKDLQYESPLSVGMSMFDYSS